MDLVQYRLLLGRCAPAVLNNAQHAPNYCSLLGEFCVVAYFTKRLQLCPLFPNLRNLLYLIIVPCIAVITFQNGLSSGENIQISIENILTISI